jgi:transposase
MGKSKREYSPEFRQGAVSLVLKEGRSVKQAAADPGMPQNTLMVWVSQDCRGLPAEQKDLAARVRELESGESTAAGSSATFSKKRWPSSGRKETAHALPIFRVIHDYLTPEFAVVDCCRVLG